jgi:hypothetical protein
MYDVTNLGLPNERLKRKRGLGADEQKIYKHMTLYEIIWGEKLLL